MDVQALLQRMAEQRAHWVDLAGGKRLRFHRPPEVEMPQLIGGVRVEHAVQYAVDWAGFTETDLLGPAAGSDTAVPFHRDLWGAWLRDNSEHVPTVAQAMAEAITAHLQKKGDVAKN
jgi:hypothetical protein